MVFASDVSGDPLVSSAANKGISLAGRPTDQNRKSARVARHLVEQRIKDCIRAGSTELELMRLRARRGPFSFVLALQLLERNTPGQIIIVSMGRAAAKLAKETP